MNHYTEEDTIIQKRQGGCQCSEVCYEVSGEPIDFYRCHCTECQRQSGSAFGMSMWIKEGEFKITSGSLEKTIRTADSGGRIEVYFCRSCGVRIYTKALGMNKGHIVLKPGTLNLTDDLKPSADIWLKSKQDWFSPPEDTLHFQGQPRFGELVQS